MAEVAVDDETGEVVVEKLVQVYDVGRAINPTLLEGQIEGGAIMGLGLALVCAIVADLGGVIDVKSAPNEGTTFSIYLPMADAENAVNRAPR